MNTMAEEIKLLRRMMINNMEKRTPQTMNARVRNVISDEIPVAPSTSSPIKDNKKEMEALKKKYKAGMMGLMQNSSNSEAPFDSDEEYEKRKKFNRKKTRAT
jgi:hypothetical protein